MQPNFSLNDKTILITGASSGIGRGIALACSAMGAKLILMARDQARLEATADACGGALEICSRDLSQDLDSIPQLVRDLTKRHGSLDGLVHAAGIVKLVPLRVLRVDTCLELVKINALAGIMLIKGLALSKPQEHPASAVIISSVSGRRGQSGQTAYCLSKSAIEGAIRAIALEMVAERIRVNAVAPSMITSEMADGYKDSIDSKPWEAIQKLHPMGMGTVEDVASAVVYLLSDAASYVTGSSLLVDGGMCAK